MGFLYRLHLLLLVLLHAILLLPNQVKSQGKLFFFLSLSLRIAQSGSLAFVLALLVAIL